MQKERFTKREFDNSRDLLRSFVSPFYFSLFEALEDVYDLRCIVEEDDETGDVFYVFIKNYGTYSQYRGSSLSLLSEVEYFILDFFVWQTIDEACRSSISLRFSYGDDCFNMFCLSIPGTVSLLVDYLERDSDTFDHFAFHSMSNFSLVFVDKDGHCRDYSSEEFEELQPALFYYLRKNGLL